MDKLLPTLARYEIDRRLHEAGAGRLRRLARGGIVAHAPVGPMPPPTRRGPQAGGRAINSARELT